MAHRDRTPTSFISIDGLAGDIVIVKEAVEKREATICSLEKELKRLDTGHEKEAKKIYTKQKAAQDAIERQIKALEQQLEQQLVASKKTTVEEIATLDDTYKAREKPHLKRIKALRVLNTLDRGRIAPVRKLPTELLGYSFQHYVNLEQPPWLLTMVSKSWKQTAITTPGLWVHLSLTQIERCRAWRVDGKKWYSTGNRVICRTLEDLNVITRYSGSLALDVAIPWSDVRDHNFNMFQAVLDGGSISQRLGSLTIEPGSGEYSQSGLKQQLEIGVFPNLHTVSLTYLPPRMNPAIFETTSTSMPRLRHLKVRSSITLPRDSSLWSRLQTLDLGMYSNLSHLNHIFPHLTLVEELRGCPRGWPNPQTPKVKLEHFKLLHVTCDHISLSSLLLPFLEQLTVDVVPRRCDLSDQHATGDMLSLHALTTLNADSEDLTVWIGRLSAPLLRTIGLRGKVPLPLFANVDLSNVETFSLDAPCSDEVLISALRCIPNAKEILLAPGPVREPLWGLGALQALAKEPDGICPNMHTFTLGTTDHRIQLSKSLANPWIRKVIKARAAMSGFVVHWSFRGGKKESVQYVG